MQNRDCSIPLRIKIILIGISFFMCMFIIAVFSKLIHFATLQKVVEYYKLIIVILGMIFAMLLFVGCIFNIKENTGQGYKFIALSALLYVNILLCGVTDMLVGLPKARNMIFITVTVTEIISAIIHILFWTYQSASLPNTHIKKFFSKCIYFFLTVYLSIVVINIFTGFLFYVDESGHLQWPGDLLEAIITLSFYALYLAYMMRQKCPLKKKVAYASFAFFPICFIFLAIFWYILGIKTIELAMSYIFILLAAYVLFFCDYYENQDFLLKQKVKLAENAQKQSELQASIMLSQIRPHFLYNVLTAIQDLCQRNPAQAENSIGIFADYLRGNMDSLGNGHIIQFNKEIEHIKAYLTLEQLRFGDELTVEYDIQFDDFSLPALVVQTIVENAVRHGATMNENGGVITIRSEKSKEGAIIKVSDNGPGFDYSKLPDDGKKHYGLENVRSCLALTGYGNLYIDSTPGIGTVVTINIRRK